MALDDRQRVGELGDSEVPDHSRVRSALVGTRYASTSFVDRRVLKTRHITAPPTRYNSPTMPKEAHDWLIQRRG